MQRVRLAAALLVLAGVLHAPLPSVRADEALDKALAELGRADSPKERLEAVRRLLLAQGRRAAQVLARLVRLDEDAAVRVGAARALGLVRADNALDLLIERLRGGGPRRVRNALGRALRRREGGKAALLALARGKHVHWLERGMALRALAGFEDPETLAALVEFSRGKDARLRTEAIWALCRRTDGGSARTARLLRLLLGARDVDARMAVLDNLEHSLHPSMLVPLRSLRASRVRVVHDAAARLLRLLAARAASGGDAEPGKPAEDRYGEDTPPGGGEDDPPPPPVPGRADFLYLIDVTGSTWGTLPRLKEQIVSEMGLLADAGKSVRVGVVAYAGGRSVSDRRRRIQYLPPTYVPEKVRAFLDELSSGGSDDRGASVTLALREALDRTGWRWSAQRMVQVYADSGCEDPKLAALTVGIHHDADRTLTRVAYVLRTRTRIPDEFFELARRGGTGEPQGIQ